jgi:hypothetical protein
MVKSYKDLIGIFKGKQAAYNTQIFSLLFDNGPLTAWQMTGRITTQGKVSLHATLSKRLRSLEKKEYLRKEGKWWALQFKGFIVSLIIQDKPKPWSKKWTKLLDDDIEFIKKHSKAFFGAKVQIDDITINPTAMLDRSKKAVRKSKDWVSLANYVKNLMQTGVVNIDQISNQTLLAVIISQFSTKDLEEVMKNWKVLK